MNVSTHVALAQTTLVGGLGMAWETGGHHVGTQAAHGVSKGSQPKDPLSDSFPGHDFAQRRAEFSRKLAMDSRRFLGSLTRVR